MSMNKYYKMLDFDVIYNKIYSYLKTNRGIKIFENEKFPNDYTKFSKKRKIFNEFYDYIKINGPLSIDKLESLENIIKYYKKGGILNKNDAINFNCLFKLNDYLKDFFKKIDQNSSLNSILSKLNDFTQIKELFKKIFDTNYNIKDDASQNLYSIRQNLKSFEKDLKDTINNLLITNNDYLTDSQIYIKNDTYVLAVKSSFKNKIKGLIIGMSDSGETVFIQPNSCIEICNKIYNEKNLESNEIKLILKNLTINILLYEKEIIDNEYWIGYFDFLNAKSIYGMEIDGVLIETKNDVSIDLIDAKHPLIDKNSVVANSLKMKNENKELIISGPNAGGKSVFLKMVGLIILMNELNIPVPCNPDSSIGFFKHIYIEIGDSQSIEANLSTFSSHILNINNIMNSCKEEDIVLIDELGNGTDPKEGEALALSVAKYLKNIAGKVLITSHFTLLKTYSLTEKSILCGSMLFDEKEIKPLYKFVMSLPGKSYGVMIAKKIGLNKNVIKDAISILNNQLKDNAEYNISILTNEIIKNKKLNDELKEKINIEDKKIKELNKNNEVLQGKLKNFDNEMQNIKEKEIEEFKVKIDKIKKDLLSKSSIKLHESINVDKQLDDLLKSSNNIKNKEPKEEFKIGDYVKHKDLPIEGTIVSLKANNDILIKTDGGKSYTINSSNLEKTNHVVTKEKKIKNVDSYYIKNISYELNLLGTTRVEAIDLLKGFLANASSNNLKRVRIIHGFGTGVIRNAVIDYLKKSDLVESFSFAGPNEGGYGATIVNLK